jgi:class 3 adenylate cyclase/tetratricopeptide (TPR) repeat protein
MTTLARHVPEIARRWVGEDPDRTWSARDGTLCFADISGFTALAERLARQGRIGGEELIETLGRIFGGMLEVARANGGELLKFGGDALFLLFEGERHALRAAATAVAMRAALRQAAGTPTSVGRLRLSMSVGLHSGPVHLFLVGAPHRELVATGPAVSTVLAMEAAAAAGEVAVSPGTAALLPPAAVSPRPDGVLLLRWRGPRASPARPPQPPGEADPALTRGLLPAVLADWLEPGPPEPEHRVACIAFVRFSGTEEVLAGHGPAGLAAALQATLTAAQAACEAEGVTLLAVDVDRDGGKLFLGAGVPRATEDDEGRMLRALRQLIDSRPPLTLQAGVSRGYVFAAELGTPWRAAYSAMGDTTNTAARICAKAAPGSLYAHPAVLEAARTLFEATPEGPFQFKGKATPQLVYRVGAESGTRVRESATALPLVGRESELAALSDLGRRLAGGRGGVVIVEAGMGLGKSRLLQAALASTDATREILRAEPYGARAAYRLLRDPVRRLLGILRGDQASMRAALDAGLRRLAPGLLPWAALVGDVAHIEVEPSPDVALLEPRFRADRTAEVMAGLLATACPGPLLLVIDDAQWADDASCAVLARIAAEAAARPWLICVARRPGDEGFRPRADAVLTLAPLDGAASHALVRLATAAAPLRPFEADLVVDRGGGNPLFIEEILRARRDAGSLESLPASLEAAIAAQIDGLDATARQLVRHAAVLGNSFRQVLLAEFMGSAGDAFDEAALARTSAILATDASGYLTFRRPLVRDTAYAGLAFRTRRRLHQAAGEAIERLVVDVADSVDLLALHFAAAGDAGRTWRYARLAGVRAQRAGASPAAVAQYRVAVDAARRLPEVTPAERVAAWTDLGQVCQLAGLFDDALAAYRTAGRLAGSDRVARAGLRRLCAITRERAGQFAAAAREIAAGRRLLAGDGTPPARAARARLDALSSMVCFAQQRYRLALRQALAAADQARQAGDAAALADALVAADSAELSLGGHATSRLEEALGIYVSLGDVPSEAMVRGNLGCAAYLGGHWHEALAWFEGDRSARERTGDIVGAAIASGNRGEILAKRGEFAAAETVLRDVIRVLRASGFVDGAAYAEVQLARALVGLGRPLEALSILERTGAEFAQLGQSTSALEVAIVTVAACTAADPATLPAALAQLDRAVAAAAEGAEVLAPQVAEARARALQAMGRDAESAAIVADGLARARQLGARYEEAMLLRARSLLTGADREQAAADGAESRAILAGLGALAPEAGRTGSQAAC